MRTAIAVLMTSLLMAGCAQKPSAPRSTPTPATPKAQGADIQQVEIASDPSFRQARGQLLPDAPDFPAYPSAVLVGSAERNRPNAPKRGHTIKWTTKDSVPTVMAWYQKALTDLGWEYTPPSDGVAASQIAVIRKGDLEGTIEAEATKHGTEIEAVLGPR